MPLNIDMSRALRTRHSLTNLVNAILSAPPSTQETRAVEWKSSVDLKRKLWRVRLAKGVLGFANRDPAVAAQWFEGCAYLVVGAEPDNLVGTTVFDAAKVEDFLEPFVGGGTSGPGWSPTYVSVDGKDVLILTVEPPRLGDPTWPFRRKFTDPGERPIDDGDIFVRQLASTEKASSADIDMLTRRARSAGTRLSGLSVVMKPDASAVPLDLRDSAIEAWVESEREALKLPPEPPKAPEPEQAVKGEPESKRRILTRKDIIGMPDDPFPRNTGVFGGSAFLGAMGMRPDPRTRKEYQAELDAYLKKGADRLRGVLIGSAFRRNWGRIELSLRNDTADNFHKVEVELYIDAPVSALFEEDVPTFGLPKRPIAFGKATQRMFPDITSALRVPSYLNNLPVPSMRRAKEIDNSASARIPMPPVDVRPRRTAELDIFFLLARPELAGTTLTVSWTATATNASGDMEGSFDIPVLPRVATTVELLTDPEDGEGGDDFDDE